MKICIITNIPAPYRLPLFAKLEHEFGKQGWNLTVIFLTKSYDRRKWNIDESQFRFRYRFLEDPLYNFREFFFSFGFSILKILHQEKPDIIIPGGFSFPMMLAMLYAKIYAIPYCLWSGETIKQSGIRRDYFHLRKLLRRSIVRHASCAVVYGKAAKEYMIQMGMTPENISVAINTVDTEFYQKKCAEIRSQKFELIQRHGYFGINLLYVGHLTEQKGLQYLFKAINRIDRFDEIAALHIVGSGPYEENLLSLKAELQINNIHFHGFKQINELLFFYAICDIFVFPSLYDIWGLVCIEAMAAKLPVICSVHCGISHDLLNYENAIIIRPKITNEMAHAILELIESHDKRHRLAEKGYELVKHKMNLSQCVNGFIQLIEKQINSDSLQ